ncbi:MAG: ABC transporter permease [Ignavibacteriota bacterium]
MLLWETFGKGPDNWNIVSAPNFWDFQKRATSFDSMAIFDSAGRGYNLAPTSDAKEAEQVSGLRVSAGFFRVLGAKPMLGRTFLPEEELPGKDREVVLSYGLWKARYNGDTSLVGNTIRIDGAPFTVVGVMPQDFEFQFWSGPRRLWVPVGYTKDRLRSRQQQLSLDCSPQAWRHRFAGAGGDGGGRKERAGKKIRRDDADMGATVYPLADYGLEGIRRGLTTLSAAVAFVLLIACVNVANLLLARGASRQKEFAIRVALGAPASRIARQLLTENSLLALAGGAAGLLVAALGTRLLFYAFKLGDLGLADAPSRFHRHGWPYSDLRSAGVVPYRDTLRRRSGDRRSP